MILRHHHVKFRTRDVFLPQPGDVLAELHGDEELEGTIVDFSDSGSERDAFAIIEVEGLSRPVMVRVDDVLPATDAAHFHQPNN